MRKLEPVGQSFQQSGLSRPIITLEKRDSGIKLNIFSVPYGGNVEGEWVLSWDVEYQ